MDETTGKIIDMPEQQPRVTLRQVITVLIVLGVIFAIGYFVAKKRAVPVPALAA